MRIRHQFAGVLGIVTLSLLLVVGGSFLAIVELIRFQTTAERGTELISRSRAVFDLTKDLSVAAFARDLYGRLKDVFYFEKFETTMNNWDEAVAGFKSAFGAFMSDWAIVSMARTDPSMADQRETAMTMAGKMFAGLDALSHGFRKLESSGLLLQSDVYQNTLESSDAELAGLFTQVRQTSYYLKNSFESYMDYFVAAVSARVSATQGELAWLFLALSLVAVAVSIVYSTVVGHRVVRHLQSLRLGMTAISRGDFSHPVDIRSRDELGELAESINRLSGDLRLRVGRFLDLNRDLGASIDTDTDLASVRRTIVGTASREVGAAGLALVPFVGGVMGNVPPVGEGLLENDVEAVWELVGPWDPAVAFFRTADRGPFSSVMVCPLSAPQSAHGVLVAVTAADAPPFTDLDFTTFRSLADFAALAVENYLKYRELIELREAELQSLQARIQPHFLYNVLNGVIGLNRLGDRAGLEAAILDLKDLLRYTLEGDRAVTMTEELAFVGKYLELQKLRFGERFDYSISVDDPCASLKIPKLLLQPLAENALLHGIEPWPHPARLDIRASAEDGLVRVEVADTGAGFDTAALIQPPRVGLLNVTRRLELAFPGSVMRVRSSPGEGCLVALTFQPERSRL
jgi:sensor histidine kinase YesM